ncbi:MAG TPA: tetratricopeptide repeat protein [Vicinamibacterales bacterium]
MLLTLALAVAAVGAQSSVAELNDAGWKALRGGNVTRAASIFRDALEMAPDDPAVLFGAGAVAHAQGRQTEAMARLERALELKPSMTGASMLLGRIAFDEGDAALAIGTYEAALKYAPGNTEIRKQLDTWRRDQSNHEGFSDQRFERFRVMFEGRANQSLASTASRILDSAFFRIGSKLGEYPPDTIVAVLYTEKQFRDITRAPAWSGGQYDGRIRIPVAGAEQDPALFEQVLVHELSHAVIAGIAGHGSVPHWLNEGLAQYFDGTSADAAHRRMKALGQSIPLKRLEGGFGGMSGLVAQVAYDESLLAVNVMADRPGFGWIRLLHRLGDGETFEQAIVNFGLSYADLEAGFK